MEAHVENGLRRELFLQIHLSHCPLVFSKEKVFKRQLSATTSLKRHIHMHAHTDQGFWQYEVPRDNGISTC